MTRAASIIITEVLSKLGTSYPVMVLYKEKRPHVGTFYASPGGNLERGERPIVTALRELREETFIKGINERMIEKNYVKTPGCHFWLLHVSDDMKGLKKMLTPEWYCSNRYGRDDLRNVEKETLDITKVPLLHIRNGIRDRVREITDIQGNRVKLRKSFFEAMTSNPELLNQINFLLY